MLCLELISAADYRGKVFQGLYDTLGDEFKIYTGVESFEPGVKTLSLDKSYFVNIENHYILNKKFCIQRGVVKAAVEARGANIQLNPRILTNWLIAKRRRAQGKPVVMWGHAWPRTGQGSKSDALRQKMRSLADVIVTYTDSQARDLQPLVPNAKVIAAPNSVYTRAEMSSGIGIARNPSDFIFVGRFVEPKKPEILIRAFARAVGQLPSNSKLIMVGDGPLKDELRILVDHLKIKDRVEFPGWISQFEGLRPLYNRSVASVSPGFMGLSGTQSFAMGVPMLISRNEPHAPEIEAAQEGMNSIYFDTDSEEALAKTLVEAHGNRGHWQAAADAIIEDCMNRYSVDLMVERLASAFSFTKGKGS